jgi:hypothetical protein
MAPDSWKSQSPFGDPQKVGPCGEEGGGTLTGKVTAFRPGQTIEVTIDEKIFHPGHYRVALAVNDRSELPPAPPVTAVDRDPCGSVEIEENPVFPILADNLLPHTQPFGGPQTFTVTLPADVTCPACTLQVIEYMSHHGVPCFYYHCADISIQDGLPAPTATPTSMEATPTATATQAPPEGCFGDCDGSGSVAVNELVTLVNISLEQAAITTCQAGNADGDQRIMVNEILAAVNEVLSGCMMPSSAAHTGH